MINKRTLLAALAAATLATFSTSTIGTAKQLKFSEAKFNQLKASGKPVMLDFFASWCGTCRVQAQKITALKNGNAAYAKIPVMKVDWDVYRTHAFTKSLKIPRRSTLVMFNGGREVGRVVAQTSTRAIENLFKKGL